MKQVEATREKAKDEGLYFSMEVHIAEKRLIELMRSVGTGEIEIIKIQNGLPVISKITLDKNVSL